MLTFVLLRAYRLQLHQAQLRKTETRRSLRRQVAQAEAYAERHGLSLDHTSYHDLGISAFKGRNASEGKLGTFFASG